MAPPALARALLIPSLLLTACAAPRAHRHHTPDPLPDVAAALDAFHRAASHADLHAYADLMAPEMVFLGTDASERWERDAFLDFARPHFDAGTGWTFTPHHRSIVLSPDRSTAWFDELLDSEHYGLCRGTGVLRRTPAGWKLAQYHLTVPVPNDLLPAVVDQIRSLHDDP